MYGEVNCGKTVRADSVVYIWPTDMLTFERQQHFGAAVVLDYFATMEC